MYMRTTLRIKPELLQLAKKRALEQRKTLTKIVEEALLQNLSQRNHSRKKVKRLTTFKGSGLRPGVDLDDSAGLLEHMGER